MVESTFFSEIDVYTFGQATAPITAKTRPKGVNIPEKQNAIKLLSAIRQAEASKLLSKWMEKLIKDQVPTDIQLDLLEAAASRKAPEFDKFVQRYNESLLPDDKLASYRTTLEGGDAKKGEMIFKNKPAAQCYICHSVKGQGGKAAPDLTNVASRHTREFMLESMIFPSAAIAENFGTTLFLLKDDIQLEGIVTRESRDKIFIKTKDNRVIEIPKKTIEAKKPSSISPMPAMDKILTKREIRDVIAFMATLK
jgi:putative heme-binding domain-containing protein